MERPNESSIVYFVRDKVSKLKGKKAQSQAVQRVNEVLIDLKQERNNQQHYIQMKNLSEKSQNYL